MRVRVNFTLEVDVEDYREATGQDINKQVVREDIQEQCIAHIINELKGLGLKARLIGRNNVYDPKQGLTVAEHLMKGGEK